jgi:16S rRNA (cytidine1402-2'-O)-methyltransferase
MPLILVNMPLGNKDDLSGRAQQALAQGKYFFVEDTRTFKEFLQLCQISLAGKTIESWHDHSSPGQIKKMQKLLAAGEDVYLASEAGSPVISDPAFSAIKLLLAAEEEKGPSPGPAIGGLDFGKLNFTLDTLPGPSAPICALELSGLPPYPFTFWGFLPRQAAALEAWALQLKSGHTHVAFEAAPRLLASMDLLCKALPQACWAIGRELTKKFQSVYRGTAATWPSGKEQIVLKGEFVLVFYLPPQNGPQMKVAPIVEAAYGHPTPKNLAKMFAALLGIETSAAYQHLAKAKK